MVLWRKKAPKPQEEEVPAPIKDNVHLTDHQPWNWSPPDLSIGSRFYHDRVKNLRMAIDSLGKGHEHLYSEGLEILAQHRKNYGPDGPVSLTILWWEWPKTHWNELRDGASMNFMEPS